MRVRAARTLTTPQSLRHVNELKNENRKRNVRVLSCVRILRGSPDLDGVRVKSIRNRTLAICCARAAWRAKSSDAVRVRNVGRASS